MRIANDAGRRWRDTDNRVRPHSSSGYRPPAPVTVPDLAFRLPMAPALQQPLNQPGQ
ncbi:Integrase catalytic region [Methylobacterium oryzae CBMB20]|uniref:Integrase catalytic region n=1 Tax=Methylobacterium oryzae CBMB20 TaxID=693986 RepID=A0A089P2K7_9HYPH|nr:Integrase catalytic region [Methylobacterium oryzae CBMB20]